MKQYKNKKLHITMTTNLGNLTNDHFKAFNAIVLWRDILQKLTDYKIDDEYNFFISNANTVCNQTMETDVNKTINDFYHYFYINDHITHMNSRKNDLFTNDYIHFLDLFSLLTKKEQLIIGDVTLYTVNLILSLNDTIKLPEKK